jgi:signal transduction histidine kinase/CheY-like chemotaxis protein
MIGDSPSLASRPQARAERARRVVSDWSRFRRFILPTLTLAIFLVSLIHSFLKTQTVEEGIGSQMTRAIWLAGQAEIDYLRWLADMDRYADGDPDIERDDLAAGLVRLRGRLVALDVGDDARPLRNSFGEEMDATVTPLLVAVEDLQPALQRLERFDQEGLSRIRAAVIPYGSALHDLVDATRRVESGPSPKWLDRDWAVYWEVGWSLAGMLFSGALLIVIMIREIHRGDELLRKSHAQEAALLLARNAAEQANAAKSRFLVAANHDMRQPLQSLSLYTAALQGSDRVAERETICEEMSSAIQAMGTMLDVLLDIENLEDGHVRVEIAEFPVSDLLAFVEREFRLPAREKGIGLRVLPSTLVIRSDPVLLERIVQNLVSNAVSYTRDGKVVVGCRRSGDSVRIEVWDSGVGVAEEELQTIFEDYYQVDNPARDRRKGLGLGLAIAQRIAKLLDHRIIVRSKLGEGSLFAIQVPRGAEIAVPPARPPVRTRPRVSVAGRALVAIEDDPAILDGLRRVLTGWGVEVFACSTAEDVLSELSLAAREPDIIIADYRLSGGVSGLDAVDRIRASFGRELPAIVMTGDTSAGVREAIKASGCRLVHKPLEPRVLRRLIDELLAATDNETRTQAVRRPILHSAEKLEQV